MTTQALQTTTSCMLRAFLTVQRFNRNSPLESVHIAAQPYNPGLPFDRAGCGLLSPVKIVTIVVLITVLFICSFWFDVWNISKLTVNIYYKKYQQLLILISTHLPSLITRNVLISQLCLTHLKIVCPCLS